MFLFLAKLPQELGCHRGYARRISVQSARAQTVPFLCSRRYRSFGCNRPGTTANTPSLLGLSKYLRHRHRRLPGTRNIAAPYSRRERRHAPYPSGAGFDPFGRRSRLWSGSRDERAHPERPSHRQLPQHAHVCCLCSGDHASSVPPHMGSAALVRGRGSYWSFKGAASRTPLG